MMDCEHAAELISAQLDGELTPAETAMLEAHLEQCPPSPSSSPSRAAISP